MARMAIKAASLILLLSLFSVSAVGQDIDFLLHDRELNAYAIKGYVDGLLAKQMTRQNVKEACGDLSGEDFHLCLESYSIAISDGQLMASMRNKVCLPEDVSLPKARAVVERYIAAIPKNARLPGAYIAYTALNKQYPCR